MTFAKYLNHQLKETELSDEQISLWVDAQLSSIARWKEGTSEPSELYKDILDSKFTLYRLVNGLPAYDGPPLRPAAEAPRKDSATLLDLLMAEVNKHTPK